MQPPERTTEQAVMQEFTIGKIRALAQADLLAAPERISAIVGIPPDGLPDPRLIELNVTEQFAGDIPESFRNPFRFPILSLPSLDRAYMLLGNSGGKDIHMEDLSPDFGGLYVSEHNQVLLSRQRLVEHVQNNLQKQLVAWEIMLWAIRQTVTHEYTHKVIDDPVQVPDGLVSPVLRQATAEMKTLLSLSLRNDLDYTYTPNGAAPIRRSDLIEHIQNIIYLLEQPDAPQIFRIQTQGPRMKIWLDRPGDDPVLVSASGNNLVESFTYSIATMACANMLPNEHLVGRQKKEVIDTVYEAMYKREFTVLCAFFGTAANVVQAVKDGSFYMRLTAGLDQAGLEKFASSTGLLQIGSQNIRSLERLMRGRKDEKLSEQPDGKSKRHHTKRGRRRSSKG